MDYIEIENIINTIIYGKIEILIPIDSKSFFILHSPTSQDKYRSTQIYHKEFNNAISKGLKDDNRILNDHINITGQWSLEKNNKLELLKKQIHTVRKGLLDLLFQRDRLQKAKQYLRTLEHSLILMLNEKQKLLSNSANSYAIMCQQRYMISRITHKEDGKPFWATYLDFGNCQNIDLINKLTNVFFKTSRINTSIIREIARSNNWRSTWSVAKSISNLFDNSITSWSQNQSDLVYWSQVYDMVYESYDRPKQEIIEDDDLLDSWLIRQDEKTQNKPNSGPDTKESKHKFKNEGRKEQFIMSDLDGAKDVYEMNDVNDRKLIVGKQNLISKQGSIKEQHMPDSKREIQSIAVKQRKAKIKDVRKR